MSVQCFEHMMYAEPEPASRKRKAQQAGPVQAHQDRKRQTWPKPKTFGMDDRMIWTRGGEIEAKLDWTLLTKWHIQGDWLILYVTGLPCLYYPLSKLREKGLYALVMDRIRKVQPCE